MRGPQEWNTPQSPSGSKTPSTPAELSTLKEPGGSKALSAPKAPSSPKEVSTPKEPGIPKELNAPKEAINQNGSMASIDTEFQGTSKSAVSAPSTESDGTALIRDPRMTPSWGEFAALMGYPSNVTGTSFGVTGSGFQVTVRNVGGEIAQPTCIMSPELSTAVARRK